MPSLRQTVLIVAALSLACFGVEFVVALSAGSVALLADSADFLEDAAVNILIFFALAWTATRRAKVGKALAALLLVPAVAYLWTLGAKLLDPNPPSAEGLTLVGLGALAVNLTAALLLARHRQQRGQPIAPATRHQARCAPATGDRQARGRMLRTVTRQPTWGRSNPSLRVAALEQPQQQAVRRNICNARHAAWDSCDRRDGMPRDRGVICALPKSGQSWGHVRCPATLSPVGRGAPARTYRTCVEKAALAVAPVPLRQAARRSGHRRGAGPGHSGLGSRHAPHGGRVSGRIPGHGAGLCDARGEARAILLRYGVLEVGIKVPEALLGDLPINRRPDGGNAGFPSGHTAAAAFGAVHLVRNCAMLHPLTRAATVLAAAFAGGSRIEAGRYALWQTMAVALWGWGKALLPFGGGFVRQRLRSWRSVAMPDRAGAQNR